MQYILTEGEYNASLDRIEKARHGADETVGKLCQMVADNMPVEIPWSNPEKLEPWGCIHSVRNNMYCDHCPVNGVCTLSKDFSK